MSYVCSGYDRVNQYRIEYSVSSRDSDKKDWDWGFAFGKTPDEAVSWFKEMICCIREYWARDDHGEIIGPDLNRIKIIANTKVK